MNARAPRALGVQALGVDGLGRKITRYAFSPRMALQSLMQEEVPLLQEYVQAKRAASAPDVYR